VQKMLSPPFASSGVGSFLSLHAEKGDWWFDEKLEQTGGLLKFYNATASCISFAVLGLCGYNGSIQLGMIRRATSDDFPGTAFSTVLVSRS
jgi:hypothetical protein